MRNENELVKRLQNGKSQLKALIKMKAETLERKGKNHKTSNLDARIITRTFEINLLKWVLGHGS